MCYDLKCSEKVLLIHHRVNSGHNMVSVFDGGLSSHLWLLFLEIQRMLGIHTDDFIDLLSRGSSTVMFHSEHWLYNETTKALPKSEEFVFSGFISSY